MHIWKCKYLVIKTEFTFLISFKFLILIDAMEKK